MPDDPHSDPHVFTTSRGVYAQCTCGLSVVEDWDRPPAERSVDVGEEHKQRALAQLSDLHE